MMMNVKKILLCCLCLALSPLAAYAHNHGGTGGHGGHGAPAMHGGHGAADAHGGHGSHGTAPASASNTPASPAPTAADAANATEPWAEGEVRRVEPQNQRFSMRHGPIPNLDMGSMTMVFQVQDPALLEGLQSGDRIRFIAEIINGQYTVLRLEKISP